MAKTGRPKRLLGQIAQLLEQRWATQRQIAALCECHINSVYLRLKELAASDPRFCQRTLKGSGRPQAYRLGPRAVERVA